MNRLSKAANPVDEVPSSQNLHLRELRAAAPTEEATTINSMTNTESLQDQIGYSLGHESSTVVEAQESPGDMDFGRIEARASLLHLEPEKRSRIKGLLSRLPPDRAIVELKDIYFSEANWYYQLLAPYYFDELLDKWQDTRNGSSRFNLGQKSRELQYFPALLFQVLAIALQFLPQGTAIAGFLHVESYENCDRLSLEYSTIGMQLIDILGRHNSTITGIEHDLARSAWLKNESRGKEAWYNLGNAIRQAQDLGLHLQSSVPQPTGDALEETLYQLWYDEHKRRLWCAMVIWDGHMAWVLGRPRSIHAADCTITPPIDCDIPNDPRRRVPHPASSNEKPSSYSVQLFYYLLSLKAHEMLTSGANRQHLRDYSLIQTMHDQIVALLGTLPPTVRPDNPDTSFDKQYPYLPRQRQGISSIVQAFLMALHRPHMKEHESSRRAAIGAALDCLEAQQMLFELLNEQHYKIYLLSSYTIEPSIFLSATALGSPAPDHATMERIMIALRKGIERLTQLSKRSAMAKSGLHILNTCCQKILSRFDNADTVSSSCSNIEATMTNFPQPDPNRLLRMPQTLEDSRQTDPSSLDWDLFPPDIFDFLAAIDQFDPATSSASLDVNVDSRPS